MGTREKIIILLVVAVFLIFGTVTLSSQINFGSPVAIFNGASTRTMQQPASATTIAFVTVRLNLRITPDFENDPIGSLPLGTRVRVLSVNDGWARIIDDRNREGYVSNEFLRY